MIRLRHLAAASAVALSLTVAATLVSTPALAQSIVFDPNNYAQNVLTAARELQQINNQITALQNQAQMLINQARNLASLPYSSLQQLQSSIQRTQQLLAQAQNIAFNVQQIDHAFQTTYGGANASRIQSDADRQRASALAELASRPCRMRCACRPASSAISTPTVPRCRRLVTSSQSATGGLAATQAGNQLLALQAQQLADLTATVAAQGRAQTLQAAQQAAAQDQGREQLRRFLTPGAGYQSTAVHDVSSMSARSRIDRLSMVAGVAVMVLVVAACAIKLRGGEEQRSSASSASPDADPLAAELARCRRVAPEQKDALEACRRVWAEQRRQFLGQSKTRISNFTSGRQRAEHRFPGARTAKRQKSRAAGMAVDLSVGKRVSHGWHRRHRSFPWGFHPIYRQRIRAAAAARSPSSPPR